MQQGLLVYKFRNYINYPNYFLDIICVVSNLNSDQLLYLKLCRFNSC